MLRQTRKEDRKKGIKSNRKKRNKKLKKTREKEKNSITDVMKKKTETG